MIVIMHGFLLRSRVCNFSLVFGVDKACLFADITKLKNDEERFCCVHDKACVPWLCLAKTPMCHIAIEIQVQLVNS
jgi:hypothetical protein